MDGGDGGGVIVPNDGWSIGHFEGDDSTGYASGRPLRDDSGSVD